MTQTLKIVNILNSAANISHPSIDMSQLFVNPPPNNGGSTNGPGVLCFLLNWFVKYIIQQFLTESAVDTQTADHLGVLLVSVIARADYKFNGQPMMDIFWAKYHRVCPVLFGIVGKENTRGGRERIGWWADKDSGTLVSRSDHYSRMTGLGAGFAAVTLRDFSKSKNENPAPNRLFWEAMARILNTPQADVMCTQFVLLKAMLENSIARFIGFYGQAGIAAIRKALVEFPEIGPRDKDGRLDPIVISTRSLPGKLQQDIHLSL